MRKNKNNMFSRAGKASINKYKILYEKNEILSKECKSIKPTRSELFSKKLSVNEINLLAETERAKLEQNQSEAQKNFYLPSSAFAVETRESYYEKIQKKKDTPAPG